MYAQIKVPVAPCSAGPNDAAIIAGLAASDAECRRLVQVAQYSQALLAGRVVGLERADGELPRPIFAELHGSLLPYCAPEHERLLGGYPPCHYLLAGAANADLVVLMPEGVFPSHVLDRMNEGDRASLVHSVFVRKFSSTHYSFRVSLDDTAPDSRLNLLCIKSKRSFIRFKARHSSFQHMFWETRGHLRSLYGTDGAAAFDAYILLLKNFAVEVPSRAMSRFQAVCLGLFATQLKLYELRGPKPTSLILYECFLRFCSTFFGESSHSQERMLRSYKACCIDFSCGGRLLPKLKAGDHCEAFFLAEEMPPSAKLSDCMNIMHGLVPSVVCEAANQALQRTCSLTNTGLVVWQ